MGAPIPLHPTRMPKPPKLTKAEKLVHEQVLAILEWASDHPGWHKIGYLEATKRAAELLEKRGVIEIWKETGSTG